VINSVVIKGSLDEEAVLCTRDKTYALKLVETTNSLLLLPPAEVGARTSP
jgi:sister chromatid cohesion protein DCC1